MRTCVALLALPALASCFSVPRHTPTRALSGTSLRRTRGPAPMAMSEEAPDLTNRKPRPKYIPGRIDDPDYVRVFDTTLRDGEQSPGATLVRGWCH